MEESNRCSSTFISFVALLYAVRTPTSNVSSLASGVINSLAYNALVILSRLVEMASVRTSECICSSFFGSPVNY